MREIKFRAWDKQHNMFRSGDVYLRHDGKIFNEGGLGWTLLDYNWERYIIQFYTGLKDKNGVEIYEGDILEYQGLDVNKKIYQCRYEVRFGEYDNRESYDDNTSGCGWWLLDKGLIRDGMRESYGGDVYDYRGLHGLDNMEVIGNIYENPELLGGEK